MFMSKFKTIEGHDPKNRLVTLSEESKGFVICKEATGFKSEFIKKLTEALVLFENQIYCSQN
jgi:hypothetical protein